MYKYIFAFLILVSPAFAEITVDVTKTKVLTGLNSPQVINGFVLFDETDSAPKFSSAAKLKIATEAKFIKVKARKTLFENADIAKLGDKDYLIVGAGKYAVEITTFDPEKGIDEKTITVDLGDDPTPPPGPDPVPPGPDPVPPNPNPVPDDAFENIGKRVSEWTVNLPKKAELAAAYKDAANMLLTNPQVTVNEVSTILTEKRSTLLGQDLIKYSKVIENINADLKKRWPMSRLEFSSYLDAVAKGLGG